MLATIRSVNNSVAYVRVSWSYNAQKLKAGRQKKICECAGDIHASCHSAPTDKQASQSVGTWVGIDRDELARQLAVQLGAQALKRLTNFRHSRAHFLSQKRNDLETPSLLLAVLRLNRLFSHNEG